MSLRFQSQSSQFDANGGDVGRPVLVAWRRDGNILPTIGYSGPMNVSSKCLHRWQEIFNVAGLLGFAHGFGLS